MVCVRHSRASLISTRSVPLRMPSPTGGASTAVRLVLLAMMVVLPAQPHLSEAKRSVDADLWPLVNTTTGRVQGTVKQHDHTQFLGIPFAAPPIESNRFRPPQPIIPWRDTLHANKWPSACPQLELGKGKHGHFMGNEDCLYLNIVVPTVRGEPGEKLPVMLWLYGGAFVAGDSHEFGWYDGSNLATQQNVVVVTVNYRVGPFGHFALPELLTESGTTGNYAMQDQRAAMRWVAANIQAFGGDSERITIFGESAGAISVCYHYASPASRGLFHAAIMQSGNCDTQNFFQPMELAGKYSSSYAERLGCSGGSRNDKAEYATKLLQCLREKTTLQVIQGAAHWQPFHSLDGIRAVDLDVKATDRTSIEDLFTQLEWRPLLDPLMPFGPVIDGSAEGLLETPLATLQRGEFNTSVPLLAGVNKNEGNLFVVAPTEVVPTTKEHPLPVFFPLTHRGLNRTFLHFFPGNTGAVDKIISAYTTVDGKLSPEPDVTPHFINIPTSIAAAALRDYMFTCSTRRAAKAVSRHGGRVYLYEFRHDISHWIDGKLLGGNYHASDLSFAFSNQFPWPAHKFTEKDKQMAHFFGSRWSNLARSLLSPDPPVAAERNMTGEEAEWPVWDAHTELYMKLELPVSIDNKLRAELCDNVWDTLAA